MNAVFRVHILTDVVYKLTGRDAADGRGGAAKPAPTRGPVPAKPGGRRWARKGTPSGLMPAGLTRKIRFQVAGAGMAPIRPVTTAASARKPLQVNEREKMAASRYDWGGTNPAIEKLMDAVEPARQKMTGNSPWVPAGAGPAQFGSED